MKSYQHKKAFTAAVLTAATVIASVPSAAYAWPHLPNPIRVVEDAVRHVPVPLPKPLPGPLPVPPLINIIKPEFKQVPVVGNAATEMVDSVNDANERVVSSATKIADKGVDVVATTVGGVPGTFGNQVLHRGEEPDIGNAIKTSLRNIVVPPIVKDEAKFHANLAKELVGDPLKLIELADPIGHFEVSAAAQAKELGLIKSESECKQVAGMGVDAATAAADAELGPVAGAIMNVASGEQAATACETASKVHTAPIAQR